MGTVSSAVGGARRRKLLGLNTSNYGPDTKQWKTVLPEQVNSINALSHKP